MFRLALLVTLLLSSCVPPIQVLWLVRDLRLLLRSLQWSLRKVSRAMIQPAHDLAVSARRRHLLSYRF